MADATFETEQWVPYPRDEVFAFFAAPENLERITPPWLSFRILDRSTPELGKGTELVYRLRIHGLPVTWESRIEDWAPGRRFVDVQLKGPYAKWQHTHLFEDRHQGTLMRDLVVYRLPLGPLGRLVAGRRVAGDVRSIFDYRQRAISRFFPPRSSAVVESAARGVAEATITGRPR